jgi:hypothetical protein
MSASITLDSGKHSFWFPQIRDEADIEAVMRLGVPSVSALENHFRPMIVAQLPFREPHAFAERQKNASLDRASLPTDTPERAIPPLRGLLRRPQ